MSSFTIMMLVLSIPALAYCVTISRFQLMPTVKNIGLHCWGAFWFLIKWTAITAFMVTVFLPLVSMATGIPLLKHGTLELSSRWSLVHTAPIELWDRVTAPEALTQTILLFLALFAIFHVINKELLGTMTEERITEKIDRAYNTGVMKGRERVPEMREKNGEKEQAPYVLKEHSEDGATDKEDVPEPALAPTAQIAPKQTSWPAAAKKEPSAAKAEKEKPAQRSASGKKPAKAEAKPTVPKSAAAKPSEKKTTPRRTSRAAKEESSPKKDPPARKNRT